MHVRGEAGIGKSRLIRALTDQIGGAQVWQCSPHHRSSSLYPVVRELERAFDGPEQLARAAVAAGLDPVETVPLLSGLLAGKGEDRPGRSPLASRTATLRALELLLVADPARHPLLLVVEDLHWADPTTVELLGRIASRLREGPSCAWRPTGASSSRRGRASSASSSGRCARRTCARWPGPTSISRPPTACRCSSRSC